ncbi:golgin subfamily A member 5-like isoform X2 [Astyanax mexicanus]|uniref:Golgin subfamily A member 5-like isoform X2 n=1 Tax=Astyanax mexicanus TaxID=7994 RepID=A0A8T2KYM2_ASTMX|nr:golgin subfamily A member 5-like isoform X2 [Astyanax mexicanus]
MRRFFSSGRDEDYSQIQYLTAKCTRLTHENVLERECLSSRERERALQVELESLSVQLCQKEHTCQDLRLHHDQLLDTLKQQRERVQFLEQRVVSVAEEGAREAALLSFQLEQVGCELQQLQSSELQLQGLVDELHQEADDEVKKAEDLQTELREVAQLSAKQIEDMKRKLARKSQEVEELQEANHALQEELSEQHSAHRRTVEELQQENSGSVQKLREMAEQFEWLCDQQRNWMCCIKRFKDCLSDEKEALVLQVKRLQEELADLKKNSDSEDTSPEDPATHCNRWDVEVMGDLQVEADRWRTRYSDLFSKLTTQPVHTSLFLHPLSIIVSAPLIIYFTL